MFLIYYANNITQTIKCTSEQHIFLNLVLTPCFVRNLSSRCYRTARCSPEIAQTVIDNDQSSIKVLSKSICWLSSCNFCCLLATSDGQKPPR